ncbi:MAG: hypothetical protein MUD06_04395 [Rhodospirillales bacterium]|jgi:hypothetical protein|nr:hypothetical protein [Rhodospirillales bacterium]
MTRPIRSPETAVRDGAALDRAIIAARKRVIRRHRQLGIPLVIWRDGRIIEVAPESVDLAEVDAGAGPPRDRS